MQRKFPIQKGIVGSEELTKWKILGEYVVKKGFRLTLHRGLKVVAIVRHKVFRWRHDFDVVQIQPTPNKMLNEAIGLRISQHAFNLLGQFGSQASGFGQSQQCQVGC